MQETLDKETAEKFIDYFSAFGKILASNFVPKKENISGSSSISVQSMRLTRTILLEVLEIINQMQTKHGTDCFELKNFVPEETRMCNCANTNKSNLQMYQ